MASPKAVSSYKANPNVLNIKTFVIFPEVRHASNCCGRSATQVLDVDRFFIIFALWNKKDIGIDKNQKVQQIKIAWKVNFNAISK